MLMMYTGKIKFELIVLDEKSRMKLLNDVFGPKKGEKVLILVDIPNENLKFSKQWKDRIEMAKEWYDTFKKMGESKGFIVDYLEFLSTGKNNAQIPEDIKEAVRESNLTVALTEFSTTSSLVPICKEKNSKVRVASMPMAEKRMENTAFKADYKKVQKYAKALEKMLNNAIGASILFSTEDSLYLDLRYRTSFVDDGDCTRSGQAINFPSGEACKVPYEGVLDEMDKYGESKTEGILPVKFNSELVRFIVKNNMIMEIKGEGKNADRMREFFVEKKSRRNIAELGIGCNPNAVVTGNVLEDEKVGLHIAYGMSTHLGGKVFSDVHQDICYSKKCPVEGITLTLMNKDGSTTELIKEALLQYDLLLPS
jgi:leucyl aminopeptidase (aminopeptidase T)